MGVAAGRFGCENACMGEQSSSGGSDQRRDNVRVDVTLGCEVKIARTSLTKVTLVDLSGTGCGIRTWLPIEEGSSGRIIIPFDTWTLDAPFTARFVRNDPGAGAYVGVQFDLLTKSEVEHIVREVFTELRRQLRNRRAI